MERKSPSRSRGIPLGPFSPPRQQRENPVTRPRTYFNANRGEYDSTQGELPDPATWEDLFPRWDGYGMRAMSPSTKPKEPRGNSLISNRTIIKNARTLPLPQVDSAKRAIQGALQQAGFPFEDQKYTTFLPRTADGTSVKGIYLILALLPFLDSTPGREILRRLLTGPDKLTGEKLTQAQLAASSAVLPPRSAYSGSFNFRTLKQDGSLGGSVDMRGNKSFNDLLDTAGAPIAAIPRDEALRYIPDDNIPLMGYTQRQRGIPILVNRSAAALRREASKAAAQFCEQRSTLLGAAAKKYKDIADQCLKGGSSEKLSADFAQVGSDEWLKEKSTEFWKTIKAARKMGMESQRGFQQSSRLTPEQKAQFAAILATQQQRLQTKAEVERKAQEARRQPR